MGTDKKSVYIPLASPATSSEQGSMPRDKRFVDLPAPPVRSRGSLKVTVCSEKAHLCEHHIKFCRLCFVKPTMEQGRPRQHFSPSPTLQNSENPGASLCAGRSHCMAREHRHWDMCCVNLRHWRQLPSSIVLTESLTTLLCATPGVKDIGRSS